MGLSVHGRGFQRQQTPSAAPTGNFGHLPGKGSLAPKKAKTFLSGFIGRLLALHRLNNSALYHSFQRPLRHGAAVTVRAMVREQFRDFPPKAG
jgi:hypothetical protein